MMRVAVWHDLPSGGGLRALAGQLRSLRALGHEAAVWTPDSFGTDFATGWLPADIPYCRTPFHGEYRVSYLDRRFDVPLDLHEWRRRALLAHSREVTASIAAWRPDVLLAHPSWWYHSTPLALDWRGPSVLYLHEPNRALFEAAPRRAAGIPVPPLPTRGLRGLRARTGRLVREYRQSLSVRRRIRAEVGWAHAFDRLLVNSLYSRESVLRAYGLDSVVCPLGVDHGAFVAAGPCAKEGYVVSVGEFSHHKDPLLAIATVAHVPPARRPQLRWFGNRRDAELLRVAEEQARHIGVDFVFRQGVSDVELARQVAGAACFLYCPRLEPLGLAPLEANLAGTVVVAVAEGGVRETVLDGVNGVVVQARDPALLAAAVERLVCDLDAAAADGDRARTFVRDRYSWERAGQALHHELLRAVHAPHASPNHR